MEGKKNQPTKLGGEGEETAVRGGVEKKVFLDLSFLHPALPFSPLLLSDMVLQGCQPLPQLLLGKDHLTILFIPT